MSEEHRTVHPEGNGTTRESPMRTRARRTAARTSTGLAVVALMHIILAPNAAAKHGGSGIEPDNSGQYFQKYHLNSAANKASNHGKAQLERTKISTHWTDKWTDVRLRDWWGNKGNADYFGWARCEKKNWWNGKCDKILVFFNEYRMNGRTAAQWRSLGCHEIGHTGNLGHRGPGSKPFCPDSNTNSCMQTYLTTSGWPQKLDNHDIKAVNAKL
ncbi:hypothetical protein [Streptomyces alkaliterrae]|uniref:Matrixin family metalloprotease n=1 Tax=Streptomyces alkaliterrae TaxID=2213162 RepID=A0A5P0YLI1_9ACTN|nr:hypothetical protein [Streptomyces alkaliterrae]MBB1257849.1 hypothetical protein [Streptomyces alkaliterrae]MQS01108.1 hypothetical protein [Streptomyces alkaliterrae]